jgi:hypothetical protein
MRLILSSAIALALTLPASAAKLEETIDRTLEVQPGSVVSVENTNGRIKIDSWDQPRVRVVARKRVEGSRSDAAEKLRKLKIEIASDRGGVTVRTHEPDRRDHFSGFLDWIFGDHESSQVDYDITVPRTMNLDIDNTNGGILVTGVNGELQLNTTNGKIETVRCAGALDAGTTNGGITAEMVRVSRDIRIDTTNGRIDLTVPSTFAADIDASTTNGSINSELPVTTMRHSRNSLRGTINGGGNRVRLSTTNGGITIRSTRG